MINYSNNIFKNLIYIVLFSIIVGSCSKGGTNTSPSSSGTGTSASQGSVSRFTIVGNYLYSLQANLLKIYDVTNAKTPILKNTTQVSNSNETIYGFGDKLFIASTNGVSVYSLANPLVPQLQNQMSHITGCDPVIANSTHVFLTIHGGTACRNISVNELQAYTLLPNATTGNLVHRIPMNSPLGLALDNKNMLYVCDQNSGLNVLDASNVNSTLEIKSHITGEDFKDVIAYNNTLVCMLNNAVAYYDITNPNNITKLSKIQ